MSADDYNLVIRKPTMTCTINANNLAHFFGSECMYKHPLFRGVVYTDGVQYIGANGAGWLLDAILAHACHDVKVKHEDFVVVTLKVNADKSAYLTFDDGNGKKVAHQMFDHTNFPLPEITFYIENKTIMLPSER
jgi:TATA-box binding protein (TBP) (component of TFIID and TFIIIB)